ncbi:hypothetical protein TNCV_1290711 [Trichonephila clavipes]|nr:hypothetical protein TNCV_1290711 [Trichonephila clavipes]
MGTFAWKLADLIKRDGTVNIRRSSRENRSTRKRVRLKLRPQDNIYRDGKVLMLCVCVTNLSGSTWSLKMTHVLLLVGHVRFARKLKFFIGGAAIEKRDLELNEKERRGTNMAEREERREMSGREEKNKMVLT